MNGRLLVLILLIPLAAQAQLQLPGIFSDNMILQRDNPVYIWGKAAPGEKVSVSFSNAAESTITAKDSCWCVKLPAQKANAHGQDLVVRAGNEEIALRNVLTGDIWLCIGQSNMEFPMRNEVNFAREKEVSDQPMLRFYNPDYPGKNIYSTLFTDSIADRLVPEKFYQGKWQTCDSITFKNMSAVAYYFGKAINERAGIPVGLINLSIGGAPLETFIGKEALKKSRQFSAKINGDWLANEALPVWIRERGRQNVGELPIVKSDENGKNHGYKPGFAYTSGIEPLFHSRIKGVICYQGESNAQEMDRVSEYDALSKLMVDNYREKWKDPRLPFYFVQLSSIDTVKYKGQLWPDFRNEQRKMLESIDYSGMAVTSDIGFRDNVHPTNKKDVGERLARWALNKTYGYQVIPCGPLPVKAIYKNGKVFITFDFMAKGLKTPDGSTFKGFSMDGIREVEAFSAADGIIINSDKKPDFIFYGWKPFSDGNLVNSENLPASTFKIKVK
jgi:sialate O-acetylesterase